MKATEDRNIIEPIESGNKIGFELKIFASLAIPIFFSQLASHATGVIAALMTGSYSTVDQAAVATGNMLFWPVFFGVGGSLFIAVSYTHLTLPTKRIV